jgi:LacI family transcriptional regulator
MRMKVTNVADKAGVSITTVSRVMNNNYPVKKETREKVEKVIEQMNFTPNSLARGLIMKKTDTIGILVPSITNLFFPTVINGIEQFMEEQGYTLITCDTRDRKLEARQLKNLTERRVDGIISIDPSTSMIKEGVYEQISKEIPLVIVNGYHRGIKCNFVLNDQEMGTIEAFDYLIELGHKRIAFLRGQKSYSYDLKEEVYYNVLRKNKIDINPDYIIEIEVGNGIQTVDMSMEAVKKIMSTEHPPTAIFACNDWMALGALNACQKLNINVPEQVSIIGYDNITVSQMSQPKLTTVDQNMYKLGTLAAQMLYENIEAKVSANKKVILDTNLVRRGSCSSCIDNKK